MFGFDAPALVIVLILVLVLFGGAKVPQLMKGLGEGMREFRKATRDDEITGATPTTTTITPRDPDSHRTSL